MAKQTAAAVNKSTEIGEVVDYGEHAGGGFENQTSADVSIPFIAVLQSGSPQLDTIKDAKPGMLFNTVTDELIDGAEGMEFIPALTEHKFVEWVPRAAGGGFVAVYDPNDKAVAKAVDEAAEYGKYKVGDNDLVETFYVYCVIVEDGQVLGMAVLAFTSTKIKIYKHWNTKLRMFTVLGANNRKVRPPLFAHRVLLKTFKDSNKKGDFYNFTLAPAKGDLKSSLLPPGDPCLEAAVKCKELVTSGTAKAAFDSQGGSGSAEDDEYVPF